MIAVLPPGTDCRAQPAGRALDRPARCHCGDCSIVAGLVPARPRQEQPLAFSNPAGGIQLNPDGSRAFELFFARTSGPFPSWRSQLSPFESVK